MARPTTARCPALRSPCARGGTMRPLWVLSPRCPTYSSRGRERQPARAAAAHAGAARGLARDLGRSGARSPRPLPRLPSVRDRLSVWSAVRTSARSHASHAHSAASPAAHGAHAAGRVRASASARGCAGSRPIHARVATRTSARTTSARPRWLLAAHARGDAPADRARAVPAADRRTARVVRAARGLRHAGLVRPRPATVRTTGDGYRKVAARAWLLRALHEHAGSTRRAGSRHETSGVRGSGANSWVDAAGCGAC